MLFRSGNKKNVDCPTSVGKDSPLQNTYFRLKNSKNAVEQEASKKFSRSQAVYAIVQVLSDENEPNLVGKFLLYKFGSKILEKINAENNPVGQFSDGVNPFDPIRGRAFSLHITKVSGFANYDNSNFVGEAGKAPLRWNVDNEGTFVPMEISNAPVSPKMLELIQNRYNGNNSFTEMVNNMFNGAVVNFNALDALTLRKLAMFAYLGDKSPNLASCEFKDWDDETTAFVNDVIRQVTGGGIATQTANVINGTNTNVNPMGNYSMPQMPVTQTNIETASNFTENITPVGSDSINLSADDLDSILNSI